MIPVYVVDNRDRRLDTAVATFPRLMVRVRRCVGCKGILWRQSRLTGHRDTGGGPSAYHHRCMHVQQRAWAVREQRDLIRYPNPCNICGVPL